MAVEVAIPRLGWNMDEGIFVGWLKEDGQTIAVGEPLFSLEGDKSTQEIESLEAGVLRIPADGPSPGQTLAVGTVIGYVVAPGESLPTATTVNAQAGDRSVDRADRCVGVGRPAPNIGVGRPAPNDDRRDSPSSRPRVSPRARRVADELGIDWTTLRGSGRTGRIRERDVRAAAVGVKAGPNQAVIQSARRDDRDDEFDVMPITSIRRTIAQRMVQSSQSTAPVTLTTTVDATNLVSLRRQFKAVAPGSGSPPIGYGDIVVTLTAIAIGQHPMIVARWEADQIRIPKQIHIGIAVDTDAGLMVPVIRDVPTLTLRQVAARSNELIERARKGKLSIADYQGSTFTVTNLGAYGIDAFTPVINPPECAILGLGRIRRQAVPVGDRVVAQDQMTMSMTFDHRIVDGAPAARFLQSLAAMIENPSPWLLP
jgi:pyruvate dehydrogenase E2 component (dihydrolipoamide acetyltransferase)